MSRCIRFSALIPTKQDLFLFVKLDIHFIEWSKFGVDWILCQAIIELIVGGVIDSATAKYPTTRCRGGALKAFEEAAAKIAAFKEDALSEESQLSALVNELCNAYNTLYDLVITLKGNLVADLLTAKEQGQLSEIVKNDMAMLNKKVTELSQMNEELQTSLLEVTHVKDKEATELHDTNQTIRTTVDEKDKLCSQLSEV